MRKKKKELTERDIVNGIVLMLLEDNKLKTKEHKELLYKKVMDEFKINRPDASKYIQLAVKEIAECTAILKKKAMIRALIDREFLLRIAKNTKKYSFALSIIKDRDNLCGLYNKNAKGKSVKEILEVVKHLNSLSEDELNNLLSKLQIKISRKKK